MDEEWVAIASPAFLHEAQFIVSLLEVEAIEAIIPDAHTVGVQPGIANALGGVRVLVRRSDARKAAEALATVMDDPEPPAA